MLNIKRKKGHVKLLKFKPKKISFLLRKKLSKDSKFWLYFRMGFRLIGVTVFFALFEIIFLSLLNRIGNIFYELWLLQFLLILGYLAYVCITIFSIISNIFKILKIITSILILGLTTFFYGVLLFYFTSLVILKIILILFLVYQLINLILMIRNNSIIISKRSLEVIAIMALILSTSLSITIVACFLPNTIEIKPKSEPELIFWCGSNQLPNDTEILESCREDKIGFMPTIRRNMVGNDAYMRIYKNIIAHKVYLYFVIGGESEFFANINTAKEFPLIYKDIREWFMNESILDNPYVTSFSIDAEPPRKYDENMDEDEILSNINYGINNYPTKEEVNAATDAIKEFTEAVKNDGKECGIIRAAQLLDSIDNDGDLSLFMRNLYSLNIKWDFSITMLYRTNLLQGDESEDSTPSFLISSFSIATGAILEGTKFTNSELSFFHNVALENKHGDTQASNRYFFIGNFKKEFKDTRYIKEKGYRRDLDICRHFDSEKVFFYDLKGFLSHYGWEGIKELGQYNKQHTPWFLIYNNSKSITFFLLYYCLMILDICSFLERDIN